MDDGLKSLPSSSEATDLMKNEGNLRLHKVASNKEEVMSAFASDDLAKDLKALKDLVLAKTNFLFSAA